MSENPLTLASASKQAANSVSRLSSAHHRCQEVGPSNFDCDLGYGLGTAAAHLARSGVPGTLENGMLVDCVIVGL